eukprot:CAMPEP_0170502240 /NCGR_PEP_ID=MMETSP0208-20121228/40921_1 /TAXON_ID=197538 /ORGANISM="Strombidium inclinatum, Strain S3" /LENGTH=110 /DNA_ID=CAMNT_0010781213 /DNA_START=934 /DNA_END=1266 /DNA_ORIENTATION=-
MVFGICPCYDLYSFSILMGLVFEKWSAFEIGFSPLTPIELMSCMDLVAMPVVAPTTEPPAAVSELSLSMLPPSSCYVTSLAEKPPVMMLGSTASFKVLCPVPSLCMRLVL